MLLSYLADPTVEDGLGAARADSAVQRHPRHVGLDLRNFDAVVALARALRDARNIGAAALAALGPEFSLRCRIGMKRAMRPRMRVGLRLGRGRRRRLLSLRWRKARIVRCLRRQAQLGLEFGDPRHKRGHLRHQRADQRVLLRVRETRYVRPDLHEPKDSDSSPPFRAGESIRRTRHAQARSGEQLLQRGRSAWERETGTGIVYPLFGFDHGGHALSVALTGRSSSRGP
jgi:hypothetical protein